MRSKSRHSMFEVSPILVPSAARFGDELCYVNYRYYKRGGGLLDHDTARNHDN